MGRKLILSTVFACTLALPGIASAQIFSGDGEPAWSRMFEFMKSRFGSSDPSDVILLLPSASAVDWTSPTKAVRLMYMWQWGNLVPSVGWQYHRSSSTQISDGYGDFLNVAYNRHLAISGSISQDAKDAIGKANAAVEVWRKKYNEAVSAGDAAYIAYLASRPKRPRSKSAYLHDQRLDSDITAAKAGLDRSADDLAKVAGGITNDPMLTRLQEAKARFINPKEQIFLPTSLELVGNPDAWQRHYLSTVEGGASQGSSLTQDITESSTDSSTFDSAWHADVAVKFLGLFDAGHASADEQKKEEHLRTSTTKIGLHFDRIGQARIQRGGWFSEAVLERFSPELTPEQRDYFFGPTGELKIIPEELVVARGLKISIYTDAASRDYIYHHFQAGGGATFNVGWFTVGPNASYSESQDHLKVHNFSDHIEIEDASGRDLVLAVIGKRYGTAVHAAAASTVLAESQTTADRLKSVGGSVTASERRAMEKVPGE